MLRVSRVPPGDPAIEEYVGQNRFECLTCPYQFVIQKRYYERKYIKKKEAEDILGGKGAWDNVDHTDVQCPDSKCGNTRAYFYMLQIRSADEPMTAFYKVCVVRGEGRAKEGGEVRRMLILDLVHEMRERVARVDGRFCKEQLEESKVTGKVFSALYPRRSFGFQSNRLCASLRSIPKREAESTCSLRGYTHTRRSTLDSARSHC